MGMSMGVTDTEKATMQRAWNHYGEQTQLVVCIEELSELTKELTKRLRGDGSLYRISEEAADVSIVLDEILLMLDIEASVKSFRRNKLRRLEKRINNDILKNQR